ncbi:hypothetical protein ZOSMA_936G00030, partial [Zostera marina]
MTWFANPFLGFLMFIPSSIIGLLIPRTVFGFFAISQDGTSLKKTSKGYGGPRSNPRKIDFPEDRLPWDRL